MSTPSKLAKLTSVGIFVAGLTIAGSVPAFAEKCEAIDAIAQGTSTQLGRQINIKLNFCHYATDEERKVLVEAFLADQNAGLTKALSKMKASGRISLPGTTGYDIAFARVIPTPTGRKIRFVTDRMILFGEAYRGSLSKEFTLTAGEFDLNDTDKKKSTGVLYPAAQLILNSDGELQWELRRNPWKLQNVIEWKKKDQD